MATHIYNSAWRHVYLAYYHGWQILTSFHLSRIVKSRELGYRMPERDTSFVLYFFFYTIILFFSELLFPRSRTPRIRGVVLWKIGLTFQICFLPTCAFPVVREQLFLRSIFVLCLHVYQLFRNKVNTLEEIFFFLWFYLFVVRLGRTYNKLFSDTVYKLPRF